MRKKNTSNWRAARLRPVALLPLLFGILASPGIAEAGVLGDHPGLWLGDLQIPNGHTLKLGVELFTRANGSPWAMVDSPDQDSYDMPVKSVRETGDTLELELSMATLKLVWAKDHFSGVWKQGKDSLPVARLQQVAAFPTKVKPQTPQGPFPYKNETLAIPSVDGVTLGATLSIPEGPRPNLVILVPGSGPSTRDERGDGGHFTFAVLADYLARHGVAVLRYDKRGVARSTGDYDGHTEAQLSSDLLAIVQAMKDRKQFSGVGLIGHSEGSAVAATVAARHPEQVSFVVSLAGAGLPGIDGMMLQDRVWAKDHGANPAEVEQLMVYVRKYYETLVAQANVEPRITALKALFDGLSPTDKAMVRKYSMNEGTLSFAWAAKPFLRPLLMSNPEADWRAVRCPVLVLNGSLDHQVPPTENIAGIVDALRRGGNSKTESMMFPSINHMLQTAKTGAEDEYRDIDETIAPVVLQRIAAFVSRRP